ncbi:hypothetical protein MMC07_000760 [Pseudocyphellaria aurata]|nr:hypothetical protein [Pseudocyphellaria aurata]
MSVTSPSSPRRQSNSEALSFSQQAAQYLRNSLSSNTLIPIPFVSSAESTETWAMCERLLLSCLRTGDDKAAHQCLEKLIDRFGATNERVMGLRGLYQEAVADGPLALEKILAEYNDVLSEDPTNTPVSKRRIALLCTLSRTAEAMDALVELLEASPTDIEAWAELSDLYLSKGLYSQAEFCLEEVLLVAPNAWNIHARLGEILYISTTNNNDGSVGKILAESVRRFCRSIELCDGYLRGYYGLKTASDRLLVLLSKSPSIASDSITNTDDRDLLIPSVQTLNQLNEKATSRLAEIIRGSNRSGYQESEIIAAKNLLDKSSFSTPR